MGGGGGGGCEREVEVGPETLVHTHLIGNSKIPQSVFFFSFPFSFFAQANKQYISIGLSHLPLLAIFCLRQWWCAPASKYVHTCHTLT